MFQSDEVNSEAISNPSQNTESRPPDSIIILLASETLTALDLPEV